MPSPSPRPCILVVTRNLPPLVGGMERLNWHMADELAKVAEVRIIGPEGSAALAPPGIEVREAPLKPLWKFLLHARALACQEARTWRANVVLAGSGLTAPIARAAARTCNARTAVYVHGLDVTVKHPVYRALWLPAIRGADRVVANSRATAELCRGIGVDPARIGIVHPGVDLPADVESLCQLPDVGRASPAASQSSRAPSAASPSTPPADVGRASPAVSSTPPQPDTAIPTHTGGHCPPCDLHNLGNRPILLSVGRLSARKGLREFVQHALPKIAARHPDVLLLVVGDAPNQALHAEAQTPASIQAAAAAAGVGGNLQFLGTITDYRELGAVYRACDVHVFPVREIPDDPEGFGMVAVESAAHGLPTVAFATGGVVDAVAEGRSGYLVSPGDYLAFATAVLKTLDEHDSLRRGCVTFARQFAWPEFGSRLVAQLPLQPPVQPAATP